MKDSTLKSLKTTIRLITALSFTLFTAYQAYLAVVIENNRVGRLIGVAFYLMITLASYFVMIHKAGIRIVRTILFAGGFILLFLTRLLNIPVVINYLQSGDEAAVFYCSQFIVSQLGTLVLLFYYLLIRTNKELKNKQKITMALMSVVIVIFTLNLILEFVLRIKYGVSIEYDLTYDLISRVLFFMGYVGTAVNFMLPPTKIESMEEQYINKEHTDGEMLLSAPEETSSGSSGAKRRSITVEASDILMDIPDDAKHHSSGKNKMRAPAYDDSDILMDIPDDAKRHSSGKNKKRSPAYDEYDIVMSASDDVMPRHGKDQMRNPVLEENDIVLTTEENRKPRHAKGKMKKPVVDDTDIVVDAPKSSKHHHSGKNKKRRAAVDDDDIVFFQ